MLNRSLLVAPFAVGRGLALLHRAVLRLPGSRPLRGLWVRPHTRSVNSIRWIHAALATLAIAFSACTPQPTGPQAHSITGHVKLTGFLVNSGGGFAGTKVVGDADGVPVELVYGSRVVARTTTVDGIYRFTGIAPGGYFARTNPVGPNADQTEDLTVANYDIAVADTLRLVSVGDLRPTPNPIGTGSWVYFEIPDSQYVEVKVHDMGGTPVRTLLAAFQPSGLRGAFWDGLNSSYVAAPGTNFWVTFVSGADARAHLVFK